MKKIFAVLILIVLSLTLVSCGKKNFDKLSQTEKDKITEYTISIINTEIEEAKAVIKDNKITKQERSKKIKELREKIIKKFDEKIRTKYPDIDFANYEQVTSGSGIKK